MAISEKVFNHRVGSADRPLRAGVTRIADSPPVYEIVVRDDATGKTLATRLTVGPQDGPLPTLTLEQLQADLDRARANAAQQLAFRLQVLELEQQLQ